MAYTVEIEPDEYLECIGFTTYAYLANKIVKRDLMKGSERALGEFLEHFIRGKLAELALKKYVQAITKAEALIDVDLPLFIIGKYLPDVLALKIKEKWEVAKFWTEVKAVTEKQRWFLLPTTSVTGGKREQPRPYCAYVNCCVNLPQDHVARLIKYAPKVAEKMSAEWKEKLADLEGIKVGVLGYALYEDIQHILHPNDESERSLNGVFGSDNWRFLEKQTSFRDVETGKAYGNFGRDNCVIRLKKLRQDWKLFAELVLANKPLAPDGSRDMGSFESQMKASFEMMEKEKPKSWFARELTEQAKDTLAEWFG